MSTRIEYKIIMMKTLNKLSSMGNSSINRNPSDFITGVLRREKNKQIIISKGNWIYFSYNDEKSKESTKF